MAALTFCPRCNREMPFELKAGWDVPVEVNPGQFLDLKYWSIAMCCGCQIPLVYDVWDGEGTLVFPKRRVSDLSKAEQVPQRVRDDLVEAERCSINGLPNAFGAMARRVVHSICADRGAPADQDLHDQINALENAGTFSPDVAARAHELRTLGRNGAHPEWEPVTPKMMEDGIALLHWLITRVYPVPAPALPGWRQNTRRR